MSDRYSNSLDEARRYVRRKRIFYTVVGVWIALSLMWFAIDMADDSSSVWFYWPMLGTGIAVAITGIVLLGISGLFGADWERRQIDRYLRRRYGQGDAGVATTSRGAGQSSQPTDRIEEEALRIGLASVFVDDQDRAERFYTDALGLEIKTNAPYGPGERWLTVVSPDDPDGIELVLHLADEPARTFRQASREIGRPAISLRTDDCWRDAARLTSKGVTFVQEPTRMDYGGIDAVFEDTSGNLINLHQD
jgi:catechol 2,3-dioxygenase-like lactoylglutathione lyase family enzyme